MILYQVAKWMEERDQLAYSIRNGAAEMPQLHARKQEVETLMLEHAGLWQGLSPAPEGIGTGEWGPEQDTLVQ